jgi:anti-sigma factor RsiW
MEEIMTMKAHLSDHAAEAFALGKLAEEQLAPLEEHLLLCGSCRRKVEEWDEFIQVARVALKKRQEQPANICA